MHFWIIVLKFVFVYMLPVTRIRFNQQLRIFGISGVFIYPARLLEHRGEYHDLSEETYETWSLRRDIWDMIPNKSLLYFLFKRHSYSWDNVTRCTTCPIVIINKWNQNNCMLFQSFQFRKIHKLRVKLSLYENKALLLNW